MLNREKELTELWKNEPILLALFKLFPKTWPHLLRSAAKDIESRQVITVAQLLQEKDREQLKQQIINQEVQAYADLFGELLKKHPEVWPDYVP